MTQTMSAADDPTKWATQSLPPPTKGTLKEEYPPRPQRSLSMPIKGFARPRKPSLKVKTLNASLHSTWESSNNIPKNVYWKEVKIRQYERTVGDNPSCSSGPPLSIGWHFDPKPTVMSIDGYETLRPPRKSQFEMVMPREERQEILMDEWKVSQGQIAAAIRINIKAKNQRRRTVNNLGKMTKIEEIMESAQRKMKRAVTFQRRPSSRVAEMTKQHMAAEAQKEEMWTKHSASEEQARQEDGKEMIAERTQEKR